MQLCTLGDQNPQVSLEPIPTQSMLMQFKQRVLEVADEMTMVSSLTDEVQHREESRQLCRKVPMGKTDRKRWRR